MLVTNAAVSIITWIPAIICYVTFNIMNVSQNVDADVSAAEYIASYTLTHIDLFSTPVVYFAMNLAFRVSKLLLSQVQCSPYLMLKHKSL